MDLSTAHEAARILVCRIPALEASLALLAYDPEETERSTIALYGTTRPTPGDPPGDDPIVVLPLSAAAGTIDEELYQIQLAVPIEAQITGADPDDGTIPLWARIFGPLGDWWADASVSIAGDGGEIQLDQTGLEGDPEEPVVRLFNGAFCRLTSAVFQG